MTIFAMQGTPGSGKSAVVIADMAEFLLSGGTVATNFSLADNWLDIIASSSVKYHLADSEGKEKFRRSLHGRAWKIGTHDTIYQLSKTFKTDGKRVKEGMGRLYLDEAQLLFNSRNWQKNYGFLEFFTQHRKLGWDVWLVTHMLDMIDSQIRGLVEIEYRLRNMQKIRLPVIGCPVWPFPLFLSVSRYAGISAGAGQIHNRRLWSLHRQYRDVYDTMEIFAFDGASVNVESHGKYRPERRNLTLYDRFRAIAGFEAIQTTSPEPVYKGQSSVWPPYHQIVKPLCVVSASV